MVIRLNEKIKNIYFNFIIGTANKIKFIHFYYYIPIEFNGSLDFHCILTYNLSFYFYFQTVLNYIKNKKSHYLEKSRMIIKQY